MPVVASARTTEAAPTPALTKPRLRTAPRTMERKRVDFMSVLWLGIKQR